MTAHLKSLLICDEFPNSGYGTGQRLMAIRQALSLLGECRVLCLTNGPRPRGVEEQDFVYPVPFDSQSSSATWMLRHATFAMYRPDPRYRTVLADIRRSFAYDLAFCSFFRTTCVAPLATVPCLLDIDAMPLPTSSFTRMLWPLTVIAMRRRARKFKALFVIRPSDRSILGPDLARRTAVLPGISATAVPSPATGARAPRVLFVGAADWGPNREAIDWMLAQGVPKVLHASGYELRLVGRGTDSIPQVPGLSGGGFVEDLGAEYRDSQIVVCPIYSGTGANIKLAEAVQQGCAVVASPYAAAGFEGILLPGVHLEVFADPSRFAQTLTGLLATPARLEELRRNAREVSAKLLNQERFSAIIAAGVSQALGS